MGTTPDLLTQILNHRLQQDDIKQILSSMKSEDWGDFLNIIAVLLGKVGAILEVSNQVSDTLSFDLLLLRMLDLTTRAVQAERGTLFLNDPSTKELYLRVADNESSPEVRFPNDQGIAGVVFQTGKGEIVPDAYADERFLPEIDNKTGFVTKSILCTPIRARSQEIVGVIQLLNKENGTFTKDDLMLLEAMTAQASAALQNAQLFQQVQKAREEETQLLEVTTAISTELQLQPLLLKIMETTTAILNAERSTLFMHDAKKDELWALVAQGAESQEIRFPSHLGIAGTVFQTQKVINIPDAYSDDRFNPDFDKRTGYITRSILCLPIINKEETTIGVIQVLNKRGGPFTHIDEKRLKAFAAQASIAIENAKLFEEVLNVKNYNESILESLSDGVVSLDAEHTIVKCNEAALRILAQEEEDMLDKPIQEFLGEQNHWIFEEIQRVFQTGQSSMTLDTEWFLDSGKAVSVNLNVTPLNDTKRERIGSLLVLEDITKEKRLKGTMSRYMTKEVAEKLLEEGGESLGGKAQVVSVLFSDIRSFTTISEAVGAQQTVSMLNDYFSRMVDVIFRHDGVLDKYIGDAIMAVFGVPFSTGQDADNAVKVGIDMLREMRSFNEERQKEGKDPINIGIGINTDEVISGNIGSLKRMDYTVIGDGVNLAARLESANKFYGSKLLISSYTHKQLTETYLVREIDRIRVKGKLQPVSVFEVLDYHDDSTISLWKETLPSFSKALDLFYQQQWEEAIHWFEKVLARIPNDRPSTIHLERCRYLLDTPPEADWDGVWQLSEK
mgnify:CR=1 FL=1